PGAAATLARYHDRLGRALASLVNLLDPDVVVLGGGMSNIAGLPEAASALLLRHLFAAGADSDPVATRVVRAAHGDASGVRGAAWLWPAGECSPRHQRALKTTAWTEGGRALISTDAAPTTTASGPPTSV